MNSLKSSIKVFFTFFVVLFVIGCNEPSPYYKSAINPNEILSLPSTDTSYGYLYLTHKKVWGNPSFSHLVIDNCRYAGIFYSNTFLVVKLLPGKHIIKIARPPEIYDLEKNRYIPNAKGSRLRLIFPNVKGGDVYAYDMETGWTSAMVSKEIELEDLKNFPVSIDCVDCEKSPTYKEVFEKCNMISDIPHLKI